MPTLYLRPQGGLANRLMCMLSGARMARRYGYDVKLYWLPDEHLRASPSDLFQNLEDFADPETVKDKPYLNTSSCISFFPKNLIDAGVDICIDTNFLFFADEDRNLPRAEIRDELADAFHRLGLAPEVTAKLARYDGIDLSHAIGLHIRRPFPSWRDFPDFAREELFTRPTDDQYLALTSELAGLGYDGPLYLATNSEETRDYIVRNAGRTVYFHDADSYDNSYQHNAVQDALVDMIMLSRAPLVTASEHSTFSVISAIIGKSRRCILSEDGSYMVSEVLHFLRD